MCQVGCLSVRLLRWIDFAQHFVAIVLDQQNFIFGEGTMCRNARKQMFAATGKFMHILGEVHESSYYAALSTIQRSWVLCKSVELLMRYRNRKMQGGSGTPSSFPSADP